MWGESDVDDEESLLFPLPLLNLLDEEDGRMLGV
jgi:hypothetical protein